MITFQPIKFQGNSFNRVLRYLAYKVKMQKLSKKKKWCFQEVKGSIFLKNRHVLSKKVSINSINTIIKCGIWQPVKFQFVSHF